MKGEVINNIENDIRDFLFYLRDFGWIAVLFIVLNGLALKYYFEIYPEILIIMVTIFILILIFLRRKKLLPIYVLIGRSANISGIIISFITVQILFWVVFKKYLLNIPNYPGDLRILLDTLNNAMSMDPGKIMDHIKDPCNKYYLDVYIICTVQLVFTWLYLGLLISSLYQKLKHQ